MKYPLYFMDPYPIQLDIISNCIRVHHHDPLKHLRNISQVESIEELIRNWQLFLFDPLVEIDGSIDHI